MTETDKELFRHCLRTGDVEEVRKILQGGEPYRINNTIGNYHKWTPLIACIRQNRLEISRLLLEQGAFVDCPDRMEKRCALHYACYNKNLDAIRLLLEFKVNVNVRDDYGDTPLHDACKQNHHEGVELLLDNGAYKDALNDDKEKPIDLCEDDKLSFKINHFLSRIPYITSKINGFYDCVVLCD